MSYIQVTVCYKVQLVYNNLFLECSARFLGGSAVPLECYVMLVVYRIDVVY